MYPKYEWGLLLYYFGISITFFIMQSLMCYSMRLMPAAMAGILIYVAIPVSYLLDWVFVG